MLRGEADRSGAGGGMMQSSQSVSMAGDGWVVVWCGGESRRPGGSSVVSASTPMASDWAGIAGGGATALGCSHSQVMSGPKADGPS
jgi:hypothetical protein